MAKTVKAPESMQELFVQEDEEGNLLCSRCGVAAVGKFKLLVEAPSELFTVGFCSEGCRKAFVQGFTASQALREDEEE